MAIVFGSMTVLAGVFYINVLAHFMRENDQENRTHLGSSAAIPFRGRPWC